MCYIVLDLEWNQPFTFKMMIKKPIKLYGEIIQIGAVKLDDNFDIIDTFKIMVSPKYYKRMHRKVSKITKITEEELQYGFRFSVAFKHFKKWCGNDFCFFTWGPDDIPVLRDNMRIHKLDTEWIPNVYNIQAIFDNQITKENRQISLVGAMEKSCEIPLESHDALHDARNTVTVCKHLDMQKGIAEYHRIEEIIKARAEARARIRESSVVKNVKIASEIYQTKSEAFNDDKFVNFYSDIYGENISCDNLVHQNGEKYICIGTCESGQKVFVRFKFIKCQTGGYRATRMVYDLNEENMAYYREKQQKAENAYNEYIKKTVCSA